jgi:hypothetical protein
VGCEEEDESKILTGLWLEIVGSSFYQERHTRTEEVLISI